MALSLKNTRFLPLEYNSESVEPMVVNLQATTYIKKGSIGDEFYIYGEANNAEIWKLRFQDEAWRNTQYTHIKNVLMANPVFDIASPIIVYEVN
jgi:hypothetical protein